MATSNQSTSFPWKPVSPPPPRLLLWPPVHRPPSFVPLCLCLQLFRRFSCCVTSQPLSLLYYSSSSLYRTSSLVCLYNLSSSIPSSTQLLCFLKCHPPAQVPLSGSLSLLGKSPNSDVILTKPNFPASSPTKTQQNFQFPNRNFVMSQQDCSQFPKSHPYFPTLHICSRRSCCL